ncbi:MAG: formate hydrogenlyase [Deltaproteobacteria bacterium HGW-Deltaproteobacteria-17]|nr:MAG: formate hydrogenlyase [Deltaproteobacteria bacterium HGW-Deltaproteobacteria-17]PKO84441.1 MAG: formate hydrogenlyase [Betaproteobacteria bacterium HGW-Betaproteobacteria-11]
MWKILGRIAKTGIATEAPPAAAAQKVGAGETASVPRLHQEILDILGRALTIRAVDAGSCNGCELELNALNNIYYNLEGLGIKFVASPRHADLLLVSGPVTRNMVLAVQQTYAAMPAPKLVVALGACAIDGGIFGANYATLGGLAPVLPVDHVIPGCPPEPVDILAGILDVVRRRLPPESVPHV